MNRKVSNRQHVRLDGGTIFQANHAQTGQSTLLHHAQARQATLHLELVKL